MDTLQALMHVFCKQVTIPIGGQVHLNQLLLHLLLILLFGVAVVIEVLLMLLLRCF